MPVCTDFFLKVSAETYSLQPKGQERGSIAENLDNSYSILVKHGTKQTNKQKLWPNTHPSQQSPSGEPRFLFCGAVRKDSNTATWWCQRRPSREQDFQLPSLRCQWKSCGEPELPPTPSSNKEPPALWYQQRLSREPIQDPHILCQNSIRKSQLTQKVK